MALFTANDTLVKIVAARLPASEIMALRGVLAILLVTLAASQIAGPASLRHIRRPQVIVRSIFEGAIAFCYITALATSGIAELTAIQQLSPILLTIAAAVFLRERIGLANWGATLAGFGGVLLIVRPSLEGIQVATSLGLLSAFFVALRDFYTRQMDPAIPSLVITLASTLSVPLLGLGLAPFEDWLVPSWNEFAGILAAGLVVAAGNLLIVLAYRSGGDIAVISPFRYSVVLWALVSALIVFQDPPDSLALAGTAIIIVAGLYLWWADLRGAGD